LLNRQPSAAELDGWGKLMAGGLSRSEAAYAFLHTREFGTRMIAENYMQLLGRLPEQGAVDGWLKVIAQTDTFQSVTEGVLASPEYYARKGADAYQWVTALYQDVLGRQPEWPGLSGWIGYLQAGGSRQTAADQFVNSHEAHLNAVQDAYHILLAR